MWTTCLLPADPFPIHQMYEQKAGSAGVDDYGNKVYWCYRGTSYEEGTHGHMNKLFPGGTYSPEMAQVSN